MTTTRARGYAGRTEYERLRIDEAAIIDAINALHTTRYPDITHDIDTQITRIRERLPDHGDRVDASIEQGIRYIEAAPDHRDPPGTIRWIIVQPDGQRIPAGARAADDMVR